MKGENGLTKAGLKNRITDVANPREEKDFSNNEVMTLIENLKSEFRAVAEGVTLLDERLVTVEGRLGGVEGRLGAVENRLSAVEDAVRIAVPSLTSRVTKLEAKVGA